eukprot:scaffold265857_cov14-Tisochrysis_lutea.AAC.1
MKMPDCQPVLQELVLQSQSIKKQGELVCVNMPSPERQADKKLESVVCCMRQNFLKRLCTWKELQWSGWPAIRCHSSQLNAQLPGGAA